MSVRKSITLPLMIFLFYAAAPLDRIELLFYDCGEEIEAPPPERDVTCPPLLCGIPFAFGLHLSPTAPVLRSIPPTPLLYSAPTARLDGRGIAYAAICHSVTPPLSYTLRPLERGTLAFDSRHFDRNVVGLSLSIVYERLHRRIQATKGRNIR